MTNTFCILYFSLELHHSSDIMVSVVTSSSIDNGLESQSSQTKYYEMAFTFLQFSHSIKYEEQTLVGWESGYHVARRKGNKSYTTGIKTCSFKIKWGGG